MPGVRNGCLARIKTSVAGAHVVGTVPFGFTWLVKTVHAYNTAAAETTLDLVLDSADGQVTVILLHADLAIGGFTSWEGWTALNPGDQVQVVCNAGVSVWLAGAELPGTSETSNAISGSRRSWSLRD